MTTNKGKNKIEQVREFIYKYIESTKQRSAMHGNLGQIESQWGVLDYILFILEDLSHKEIMSIDWGEFLSLKGFGAKSATHVIEELKPVDSYKELVKLRNEYEKWRKKKIKELQKTRKNKAVARSADGSRKTSTR